MTGVFVKRALQQGLQRLEFEQVAKFRRTDGLLRQVVAQHEARIGFQHQIGRQTSVCLRQQLRIR